MGGFNRGAGGMGGGFESGMGSMAEMSAMGAMGNMGMGGMANMGGYGMGKLLLCFPKGIHHTQAWCRDSRQHAAVTVLVAAAQNQQLRINKNISRQISNLWA